MPVQSESPAEVMDGNKYLKLISPPPEGDERPWFTSIDEDGFRVLWEAVIRLELVVHRNKSSGEVGGAYLLEPSGVRDPDEAMATKNPPPPPPGWRGVVSPIHE